MRWLIAVILNGVSSIAYAGSYYHCVAPMLNAAHEEGLPHPELTFRLHLGDQSTPPLLFTGQGFAFDGTSFRHMKWVGTWIDFDGRMQLVGDFWAENGEEEWRGNATFLDYSVMLLKVDRGNDRPALIISCLPTEGA